MIELKNPLALIGGADKFTSGTYTHTGETSWTATIDVGISDFNRMFLVISDISQGAEKLSKARCTGMRYIDLESQYQYAVNGSALDDTLPYATGFGKDTINAIARVEKNGTEVVFTGYSIAPKFEQGETYFWIVWKED